MYQFGIDKNGADCRVIRPHLREIDPLFDIEFDYDSERYRIMFAGNLFRTVWVGDMNAAAIEDIRKAYWINVNGDPFAEIEKTNDALDAAKDRRREDMVRELAKDLRWAIKKEF